MATPRIFVSHSHVDDEWCRCFVQELRAAGFDVWYDARNLRGGDFWIEHIEKELQGREVFMIILTPEAWQSSWVRKETELALSTKRKIVRVQHKAIETAGFLSLEPLVIDVVGQDCTTAAQLATAELVRLYGPVEPMTQEVDLKTMPSPTKRRVLVIPTVFALLLIASLLFVTMSRIFPSTLQSTEVTIVYALLSDGTAVAVNASDGKLRWSFQRSGDHLFPIATVSNGMIYISSLNDYIYAIRTSDGKLRWSYKVGQNGTTMIMVIDNVVYAVLDHSVDALKADDGTFIRRYQVGNDNTFLPRTVAEASGIVYVITDDYVPDNSGSCPPGGCVGTTAAGGSLNAFKASDGSLLWHSHTSNAGYSSLVAVNGVVYVDDSASLDAFQGSNGQQLWSSPASGHSLTLSVSNGVVCCSEESGSSGTNYISALALSDGHILWRYPLQGFRFPNIYVNDGVIYMCECLSTGFTQSQGSLALDSSTGKSLWFFPRSGVLNGYVQAVNNGVAYFSSRDDANLNDYIDALHIKDGSLAWSLKTTGLTSPVEAGGILYTGIANPTADPHLYAIRASDGSIVWRYLAKANTFEALVGQMLN